MTVNYSVIIEQAKQYLVTVRTYRAQCGIHPENPLRTTSPIAIAKEGWFDVVLACEKSIEIYKRFNCRNEAAELVEHILAIGQTCDLFTSYLAIRLYRTLAGCTDWLEQVVPGIRVRLKQAMALALSQHLQELESRFWVLADHQSSPRQMGAFEFWRDLVETEEERKRIDISLCQAMELGAHICELLLQVDGMYSWYHQAAIFCQERIGDADWAGKLLSKASKARLLKMRIPINPNLLKALEAEAPDSPAYVAAMDNLDIQDSLTVIMHKELQEQHQERFLPTIDEVRAEYSAIPDKLARMIADPRFVINHALIQQRQTLVQEAGLINFLGDIHFIDQNQNMRGAIPNESRFVEQYVFEIEEVVSNLLLTWQHSGDLLPTDVIEMLKLETILADTVIIRHGIAAHFQDDYIASVHILMPQLENLIRRWLHMKGIDTKRVYRGGGAGEALLNDLIHPENAKVKAAMGEGLFDVIYWYLVNSASQFGYRHKVAHGWITSSGAKLSQVSAMLIWIMLRIASQ